MPKEKGALPPQHQAHQPGRQSEMRPRPKSEAADYRAADKLKGRKALITGGDSGIGRAVAITFAKEGADVAIVYREACERDDAEDTRQHITSFGRKCVLIEGDIGDEAFCMRAVAQTVAELGALDILINNAGEQHVQKGLEDISAEQLERTYRTNIFGMMFMTKAALKHLVRGAAIVNTASVTAYKGKAILIDYASTKGAIIAFTRSLAESVAERGIRVNGVAPGPIWTPLIPASYDEDQVAKFGKNTLLGRPGEPDEVAPCYVFLAGPDSSYMTGQMLHPNGGEPVSG